jgi:hypothetical protein
MKAGGVAEGLALEGLHGVPHLRIDRRGGIVIQVNAHAMTARVPPAVSFTD